MAIIKFENVRSRMLSPSCSITSYGTIGFNGGAVKKYGIKHYKRCILYYDPDVRKIYIEFTNDENDRSTFLLRHRNPGADIGARGFFNHFENMPEDLTNYPIERGENENMLVIDMTKGTQRKGKSQEN